MFGATSPFPSSRTLCCVLPVPLFTMLIRQVYASLWKLLHTSYFRLPLSVLTMFPCLSAGENPTRVSPPRPSVAGWANCLLLLGLTPPFGLLTAAALLPCTTNTRLRTSAMFRFASSLIGRKLAVFLRNFTWSTYNLFPVTVSSSNKCIYLLDCPAVLLKESRNLSACGLCSCLLLFGISRWHKLSSARIGSIYIQLGYCYTSSLIDNARLENAI